MPQRTGPVARRAALVRAWWSDPFGIAPRLRIVALAALLVLALLAALTYTVGHWHPLPPPFGPAGNGVIVFDVDRRLFLADGERPAVPMDVGLSRSWGAAFAPDGTRFAFWSQAADGAPVALWVANADVTGARPITEDVPRAGGLAWSPDSTRITFESDLRSGRPAIYVAAADGSGVTRISPDDDFDRTSPNWSPRGDLIAYRKEPRSGDRLELAVMSPDGRDERTLAVAQFSTGGFKGSGWSPDGTRIAYFRMVDWLDVVETVDLRGTVERLSGPSEDAFNPTWSNDGSRVAYALRSGETVVVDLATAARTTLAADLAGCGISWSPDDRFLIGLGADCRAVSQFPVDDPGTVSRLSGADGDVVSVGWQRVAP